MHLSKSLFGTLICLTLLMSGCGPMNTETKSDTVQTGTLGQTSGPAKVTANDKYYVSMNLVDANGVTSNPREGENTLVIRSVHAADLHPLASNTKLAILYEMPDMPGMETEDEAILQADGSFLVTVVFSMKGIWKVTLTIKDGDLQDEYIFETNI